MSLHWLDYFIIASYVAQLIQIFFYSIPSAGSTCEMLFNSKRKPAFSNRHPAAAVIQSKPKIIITAAVTLAVLVASMIPILTLLFPKLNPYLLPLIKTPSSGLSIISACLLIAGNSLTYIAVATLKAHVRFHEFGETAQLHTAGIYRHIRNPITLGLAAIFAGFVLARLSVVMLIGFCIFLLNSNYRIKMEEVYLEKTFGAEYLQYRDNVGKYFPKIHRGVKSLISKNS